MDELGDEEISESVCRSVSEVGRRTTVDAVLWAESRLKADAEVRGSIDIQRDSPPEEKRRLLLYVVLS